jgi:hypothetical protein
MTARRKTRHGGNLLVIGLLAAVAVVTVLFFIVMATTGLAKTNELAGTLIALAIGVLVLAISAVLVSAAFGKR